jgi:thiamine pyrophosphate-dependent acetolactate synthase large subunit-like protein
MNRLDATKVVLEALGEDSKAAIIASLGHPAYDLFAAGDRPEHFYTWGSMGLASSMGLGLAMAKPELPVIVLDGDGSLLMNLGSLATIGWTRPPNLVVIVWDNGSYGTTGGQDSATAHGADLEAAARAMGIPQTSTVGDAAVLRGVVQRAREGAGPWLIVAKVAESMPAVKPPLDYVWIKERFMSAIGTDMKSTKGATNTKTTTP